MWAKLKNLFGLQHQYALPFRKKYDIDFERCYTNPWPGNLAKAQLFLQGQIQIEETIYSFAKFMNAFVLDDAVQEKHSRYIHSFTWIKDLRCVADNVSRKLVRKLIQHWIDHNPMIKKNSCVWSPYVVAKRLENWITLFDFYGASGDDVFLNDLKNSIIDQYTFLVKQLKVIDHSDHQKSSILKTLIFLNILFDEDHKKNQKLLSILENVLEQQVYPDGGHKSLDPIIHLNLLCDLIDLRSFARKYYDGKLFFVTYYINKMIPILRLFRHGDGCLTSFRNDHRQFDDEPSATFIDMVLSLSDVKGKPAIKAPDMGYERLNLRSSQLVVQTKPHHQKDDFCGTGCGILAFEWSLGKKRLIEKGDLLIQVTQKKWLHVSTEAPKVLKLNRHLKEGQVLFDADFETISTLSSLDDTSIVFHFKRQLYLGKDYDFRGSDRLLLSRDCLAAVRFVFPKGTDVTISKTHHNSQAIIKFHSSDKTPLKDNHTYHLWRFMCDQCEDISVQKNDENGQVALLLLQKVYAEKPKMIRWAFHPVV